MTKDYYKMLGISKDASQEEIKRAFRKLAHQYHPDKENGDEKKFKEVNEAYQVLSNPEKRGQYDQFGQTFEQARAQGGFSGFEGFRDFSNFASGFGFEDLGDIFSRFSGFEDIFSGFGGQTKTRAKSGQDIQIDIELSLKEAAFGIKKEVELKKYIVCPKCSGNAAEPGTRITTCSVCNGSGRVAHIQRTILGNFQTVTTCRDCKGEGKMPETLCRECRGEGRVKDYKKIEVSIPAGIDDEEMLRVTNEGEAGPRGGRPGSLYIKIHIKSNSSLTREGVNVFSQEEISFRDAALGTKLDIETLDGISTLKIPEGTQPGAVFRLKNKGVPHLHGRDRGDHLVEIVVKVPRKLSRKQKELLEEFGN